MIYYVPTVEFKRNINNPGYCFPETVQIPINLFYRENTISRKLLSFCSPLTFKSLVKLQNSIPQDTVKSKSVLNLTLFNPYSRPSTWGLLEEQQISGFLHRNHLPNKVYKIILGSSHSRRVQLLSFIRIWKLHS